MKLNAAILFAALSVSAAASDSARPGVRTLKNDKKSKSLKSSKDTKDTKSSKDTKDTKSSKKDKKAKSNTVPVPPATAAPVAPATVAPVAPPVCEGSPYQGDAPLYAFNSKFTDASSVAYSGQTARQLLINKMKDAIGDVVTGKEPGSGVNRDLILKYYDCEPQSDCYNASPGIDVDPLTVAQNFIGYVGSVTLVSKIAGNDVIGPHKDWEKEFVGWNDWGAEPFEIQSPDNLVRHWANVVDYMAFQNDGTDPAGNPITKLYVSPEGQDYQQLIQKFVLGAVAFSQGADDYLDNDTDGKGLNSDNTESNKGKAYSALEHGWDEAYGYFGAAADYLEYTDDEIAGKGGRDGYSNGYHDTDGNGEIDLKSEKNFGHSLNAAKRDRGSVTGCSDLTSEAYGALYAGRSLITAAGGALTDDQMAELVGFRDTAVGAWEKAISATVIHYINDCLSDISEPELDFYNYAKHWSEAKGFALSFQFNRLSPVSDEDFARVHELLRDAPELDSSNFPAWEADLLEARDILEAAYEFDAADAAAW